MSRRQVALGLPHWCAACRLSRSVEPITRLIQLFHHLVDDLAASTILLPDAILDLDLQPEQTIALLMIMVSSVSAARDRISTGRSGWLSS
jgi:hypothetical protein